MNYMIAQVSRKFLCLENMWFKKWTNTGSIVYTINILCDFHSQLLFTFMSNINVPEDNYMTYIIYTWYVRETSPLLRA